MTKWYWYFYLNKRYFSTSAAGYKHTKHRRQVLLLIYRLTHLMATLLPSITTGLKPATGSLSGPPLDWQGPGLQPLDTSLGLFGRLLLQVFISSSRMSLVWASWRRLSSTLTMSLCVYPNLRNRSTFACCCWWCSMISSPLCSQDRLSGRGILLASLFCLVSTVTVCFWPADRCQKEDVTVNTGSTAAVTQGVSDKLVEVLHPLIESVLVTTNSWLPTQAQHRLTSCWLRKPPSHTPREEVEGLHWSDPRANFTSSFIEVSYQNRHEWNRCMSGHQCYEPHPIPHMFIALCGNPHQLHGQRDHTDVLEGEWLNVFHFSQTSGAILSTELLPVKTHLPAGGFRFRVRDKWIKIRVKWWSIMFWWL